MITQQAATAIVIALLVPFAFILSIAVIAFVREIREAIHVSDTEPNDETL